jgi:uncharacterized membrane protein
VIATLWPVRVVLGRPRLFGSLLVGAAAALVLAVATGWRPATRMLVAWDVFLGLYLLLVAHLMASSTIDRIRQRAAVEDEGQVTILVLTVAAALASLAAIFAELGAQSGRRPFHVALAGATILLSWAFIHTIFALHYAHEFYDADIGGGLAFPGDEREPDYWDFVYFSFVIGMTSQVSDIGVTNRVIRRIVTAHGVVSFVFNATLLALTVNIAASAI